MKKSLFLLVVALFIGGGVWLLTKTDLPERFDYRHLLDEEGADSISFDPIDSIADDSVYIVLQQMLTEYGLKLYENEYYTLVYPDDWEVYENIADISDTLGLKPADTNADITCMKHEVDFSSPFSDVFSHIVKSQMELEDVSIEDYALLSLLSKGIDSASDSLSDGGFRYIDYVEKDTCTVSKCPAICLHFRLVNQTGDTLSQKQYIVKNDKKQLFYINTFYPYNSDEAEEYANIILHWFVLK